MKNQISQQYKIFLSCQFSDTYFRQKLSSSVGHIASEYRCQRRISLKLKLKHDSMRDKMHSHEFSYTATVGVLCAILISVTLSLHESMALVNNILEFSSCLKSKSSFFHIKITMWFFGCFLVRKVFSNPKGPL